MKLDNKGFVVSTLMYALLITFLFLIIGIITLLANRKMILDKLKKDIKGNINEISSYDFYSDGEAVYYNPVTDKICNNYVESNSSTGITNGCLKWYAFNDNINKAQVNLILDHNTSGNVAWNSSGNNADGMKEVLDRLSEDTEDWQVSSRLIKADEIAHIVGADRDDTIKWEQRKQYGTDNIINNSAWFYLDGGKNTNKTSYSTSDGWQKQVATSKGASDYAWLYDNTSGCESNGCNKADSDTRGYWTQDAVVGFSWGSWVLYLDGSIGRMDVNNNTYCGVRPVVSVDKSKLGKSFVKTFAYTGKEQTFVVPHDGYYKLEAWGAEGGNTTNATGGKGAYTSGIIQLEKNEKLYLHVGGKGTQAQTAVVGSTPAGGYNGGANGYVSRNTCTQQASSGGGATDIRLVSGTWNSSNGLNSRIMVAAGGGGAFQGNCSTTDNCIVHGGSAGSFIGLTPLYVSYSGFSSLNPTGATQIDGGKSLDNWTSTSYSTTFSGSFGSGSTGNASYSGGGGGYYGGASGKWQPGSGGSSFISGYAGVNAISSISSRAASNNTLHYSKKYFINSTMSSDASEGNGKVKITYVGSDMPAKKNNKLDNVRYIKDCTNGSNVNAYNHWVELQAIKDGSNLAKGKTATGITGSDSYPVSRITDGDITTANYADGGSSKCITIDLAKNYNLDEVAVWHYYGDGRIYNENVTSVSSDNENWTTIISTTEKETVDGKRFSAWD